MVPLSVGLLGLSHLHPRLYMPLFTQVADMEVVAVCEAHSAVRGEFTRDFPVRAYAEWQALLEHERLDLAILFLPHAECPDAAVACAERGVHLLVEKPMAANAHGARRMIAACAQHGVSLAVPYLWRYHPVALQMKKLIGEGVLGRMVSCEGRCAAGRLQRYIDGHARWMLCKALSGGGPMFNLGVHWIDLYRWLLEDEVVEVIGKNVKINEEYDIEDNSFALLTFSQGTVVALNISYTVPDAYPFGRDLHLSLRGTSGVLAWNPSFEGVRETLFVCSDADEYRTAPRRHLEFELPALPGYVGSMGVQFMRELAEVIRAHAEAPITGLDGLRALEVVEAIYQSAETGRAVRL